MIKIQISLNDSENGKKLEVLKKSKGPLNSSLATAPVASHTPDMSILTGDDPIG
jgi:hypothetical protein